MIKELVVNGKLQEVNCGERWGYTKGIVGSYLVFLPTQITVASVATQHAGKAVELLDKMQVGYNSTDSACKDTIKAVITSAEDGISVYDALMKVKSDYLLSLAIVVDRLNH